MKRKGPVTVAVLAAALLGLLVYGIVQQDDDTTLDKAVSQGVRPAAPDRAMPDLGTKLAKRYGTLKLPETFVIDRKGRVAAIGRGQLNEAFLKRAIDRALRS